MALQWMDDDGRRFKLNVFLHYESFFFFHCYLLKIFSNVMAIDDDGRVGRIECPPFLGIGRLTRKLGAKHGPG